MFSGYAAAREDADDVRGLLVRVFITRGMDMWRERPVPSIVVSGVVVASCESRSRIVSQ